MRSIARLAATVLLLFALSPIPVVAGTPPSGGNANFRVPPADPARSTPAKAKKLKVVRSPRAAPEALAPIDSEPGYCGDGLCRGADGESSSNCPDDCGGGSPPHRPRPPPAARDERPPVDELGNDLRDVSETGADPGRRQL